MILNGENNLYKIQKKLRRRNQKLRRRKKKLKRRKRRLKRKKKRKKKEITAVSIELFRTIQITVSCSIKIKRCPMINTAI